MSPIESAAWRVVLRHSDSRRSSHRFRLRRYRGCQNRNPLVAWSPHVSYLVGGRRSLCRTHLSRSTVVIPCRPTCHFFSVTRRKWDSACTTPSARLKPPRWSVECSFWARHYTQPMSLRNGKLGDHAECWVFPNRRSAWRRLSDEVQSDPYWNGGCDTRPYRAALEMNR